MTMFFVGISGVLVGALMVIIAVLLTLRYLDKKETKKRQLEHKVKEIEVLLLLNRKIIEILEKRTILMDRYVSFDSFDDCYITVDDYIYLQSFAAQNNFYLPNYFLEEFFKQIATRRVILSPEETVKIGGYAYKGGRLIMEEFSDKIEELIQERKGQMKQYSEEAIGFLLIK